MKDCVQNKIVNFTFKKQIGYLLFVFLVVLFFDLWTGNLILSQPQGVRASEIPTFVIFSILSNLFLYLLGIMVVMVLPTASGWLKEIYFSFESLMVSFVTWISVMTYFYIYWK